MSISFSSSRMAIWAIWMVASIFYAYQYILRVMPNIMLEDIMQQFHIGAAAFGQFSGIYYIGYSLMHLPIGIMLDRYGPKKVMSGCILLTVVGMLPLIFADHWIFPIAGRLLIGMGSSAAILGVFKIIRMAFSEERFPRMLSLSVTIGLIGAIYGGGPMGYMRELFGYQFVIEIFAVLGVALAFATYWIVPNVEYTQQTTVISDIKEVLGNARVIWTCIFAGLMVGPLEGFADVWGTAFLKQAYGFDKSIAASLPSMIFIGMCFGAPILSMIADKVGSYLGTVIGAGAAMALSFALMLSWNMPSGVLSFSFVVVGICSAYQILAIYKASTYVKEHVAGLTTAVANMVIMIFGYAFHTAIGTVINAMGGPEAAHAFAYGIAVIPITLCIGTAGFVLLLVKEKSSPKQILQPSSAD
jgi:predicted MFS family arabinose efflux permease